MTDTDMLYMASLKKRNEELEAKAAELEGKHWNECGQIAHYSDELRKAKRLLKAAMAVLNNGSSIKKCEDCNASCTRNCKFKWRYTDEALALIGEDTANVI